MEEEKKNIFHNTKTKSSYGIACCRISTDGIPEILLIQKRHTYSFVTFVLGCDYIQNHKQLRKLFNSMTHQEKADILQLDYAKLWYQICGNIPSTNVYISPAKTKSKGDYSLDSWESYMKHKTYFDTHYGTGSRVLSKLMHDTKSINALWDIPKGRRQAGEEKDFDIAIREFQEETSSTILEITPMFHCNPVVNCYIDGKWKYINTFFIAEADSSTWKPSINFMSHEQVIEVQDIQWFSLARLKAIDPFSKYHKRLVSTVEIILKKYKKNRKT